MGEKKMFSAPTDRWRYPACT